MEIEKIRNTTEAELRHQEHDLSEQLFRLKFQMKMGQTESLKKIRGLRRDIARIKTVGRERELGIGINAGKVAKAVAEKQEASEPARARVVAKPAAAKAKPKAAASKQHKAAKKSAKHREKK